MSQPPARPVIPTATTSSTPEQIVDTELRPAEFVHKPDGPLSAALLGAGVGILTLGFITTLAEANETIKGKLSFNDDVGPLSGKTVWTVIVWLVAWGVAAFLLRGKDNTLRTALIAFLILTVLGYLGTFPTFFQAFAPD